MELRKKLISVAALAFTVALGAGMACMTASAEEQQPTLKISGVAVRTENFKDAQGKDIEGSSGIRFKTDSSLEKGNFEAYTIVSAEGVGSKKVAATAWRPDNDGWNTVVAGIPKDDYVKEITAQSFIVLSNTQVVISNPVSYSISQAAAEGIKQENLKGAEADQNLIDVLQQYNKEPVEQPGADAEVTLSFANTSQRVSQTTEQQVWSNNGVTFTNDKAASTSNVIDSSNPVRLYANSKLTIEASGLISKIVFDCNSTSYATALKNSIGDTAVADSDKVTVDLDSSSDTFVIEKLTAQVRMDSLTVTVSSGAIEDPTKEENQEKAQSIADSLALSQTTLKEVGETLNLPLTTASVSWSLQDTDLLTMDAKTIKVSRLPAEDTTIALTATVTVGSGENMASATMTDPLEILVRAAVELPEADSELTIAEALAWADYFGKGYASSDAYSTDKYYVRGEIKEVSGATNGNMTIVDENGEELYINGTYSADGATRYDKLDVKPVAGDTVTVYGVLGMVNNTKTQMNAGWITEYTIIPANKLATEAAALSTIATTVKEATTIDLPSKGKTHEDVDITWTKDVEDSVAKFVENQLVINEPTADGAITLTAKLEVDGEDKYENVTILVQKDNGEKEIIFNLGDDGVAEHKDGSSKPTYDETVNGYTLNITGGTNMYLGAIDAKGNGAIKFGASSKAGSMTFTVPADVNKVVLYVAKYKANTSKVDVNGTAYTLTKNSNDGAYDEIVVDTTTNKTITFKTVSGGYRCMLNSIKFVIG